MVKGRRVVLHARGHANIRATHAKTLEFTADPAIGPRATCVAGVGLALDPASVAALRGPVRLTVEAGDLRASGTAVINPGHQLSDRLVVRRAATGGPETLAVLSTLVASDLDAALVAALARPDGDVRLTVEEDAARRPLLLVRAAGDPAPTGRLGAVWEQADLRVRLDRPPLPAPEFDGGDIVAVLATGTDQLDAPAGPVRDWLSAAAAGGARFRVVNRDALLDVLLAAGLPGAPVRWLGRADRRTARERLVEPFDVPTVLAVAPADAAAVLGRLADADPARPVAVESDALDLGVAVDWTTAAGAVDTVARHPGVPLVVVAARAAGPVGDLLAVARALVDAGVPARTVGGALDAFGLDRRALYAALGRRDPPGADGATGVGRG